MKNTRYIFLTGGVSSSSGKGVTCASIGALLETYGYSVSFRKLDGYINVNAGTMNPEQHGEVYVLDDGSETDLDLGHYNRFTTCELNKYSSITMGSVYQSVINQDVSGEYDGQCVQVIPHVVDELKKRILNNHSKDTDFVIVEIGGTVGDIESAPMVEAIREIGASFDRSERRVCFCHLVLIPYIKASSEWKTKPAQNSCAVLRSMGITPDILMCRVEDQITQKQKDSMRNKLEIHTGINEKNIIYMDDAKSVYEIPVMHWESIPEALFMHFGIRGWKNNKRNNEWAEKVSRINIKTGKCANIGVFGKYTNVRDSYKSIHESLNHAAITLGIDLNIKYFGGIGEMSGDECNGVLIPGGFGYRGIPEKEEAFLYSYYNEIPCLGLCLGLQTSVVSFGKNICNIKDASYEEFKNERPGKYLIHLMEQQKEVKQRSGTMRLGEYRAKILNNDSLFAQAYLKWGNKYNRVENKGSDLFIYERHRHRYEVNADYLPILEEQGLKVSAINDDGLVEAMEIEDRSRQTWYIGVQYHPEYKSKFLYPHPLFVSFLEKVCC